MTHAKPRQQHRKIVFDRSASAQLYDFIRDAIVSMEYEPGQMIPEKTLAEQFGVSRTPVREALIKLSHIGFVEVRPQRGTYVSLLSMDKILAARFIREALELAVIEEVATLADAALIEACSGIIEQQRDAAEQNDSLRFQKLDDAFHQTLAQSTGYERVGVLIDSEKAHMDRVRNLSLHIRGQYHRVLEQHEEILGALKRHSPEQARKAMARHMQDVYKALIVIPREHPEYFTDD